jgi:hypothetical protein
MSVHKDPEHKATMSGFKNFLCGSPLSVSWELRTMNSHPG